MTLVSSPTNILTTMRCSSAHPFSLCDYTKSKKESRRDVAPLRPTQQASCMQVVPISPHHRVILINWVNEVVHYFGFDNVVLDATTCMVDFTLSTRPVPKKHYQLVGISCFLAVVRHIMPPASRSQDIMLPESEDCAQITDNTYTATEIEDCCSKLLRGLGTNSHVILGIASAHKSLLKILGTLRASPLVENLSMVSLLFTHVLTNSTFRNYALYMLHFWISTLLTWLQHATCSLQ